MPTPKGAIAAGGSAAEPDREGFAYVTVLGDGGSSEGPVSPVSRGEWKIIVILTICALIDGISPDRRRIKVFQDDISAVSAKKIVAASARQSSLRTEN